MLVETTRSPAQQAALLVVLISAALWLIEVVDRIGFSGGLDQHGIVPRTIGGLDGILWAPLLHGGFGHVLANTVPFLVLGGLVAMGGMRRWLSVTAIIVIVGGLATWLLARPATHIGVSGLVFGYAGFLLVAGFVERSLKGVSVAVIVVMLFGGMLLRGIVPVSNWVSWESHVFGFSAGVLAAFMIATPPDEQAPA